MGLSSMRRMHMIIGYSLSYVSIRYNKFHSLFSEIFIQKFVSFV